MRESKDVFIDGHSYHLQHFPATKGYKILTRLLKIVGSPLGIAANGGTAKSLGDIEIGSIVAQLFEKLDSTEGQELFYDLLDSIYINNRPLKAEVETHFAGRIGSLIELLTEQVKFQYQDVFQKLAKVFQEGALAGIIIQSPNTSIGQSGDASLLKSQPLKK
jgi:hypothetical protein